MTADTSWADTRPVWGAIFAMTLCCAVLVASEFMPLALLTPMAADLGITEGQAGQAISISGFFAVAASLLNTTLMGRLDRRLVLIGMALLMALSGTLVALAPNFAVLMVGRALLGIAVGLFWSLNTSVTMRLLPAALVPLGLTIAQGGTAMASVLAAPAGSYMGEIIGWRGAFFAVVPLALIGAAWQAVTLPHLPARGRAPTRPLRLLGRPVVVLGMVAVLLYFMGHFAAFTYLRPFLEQITGVQVPLLSVLLFIVGATGLLSLLLVTPLLRLGLTVALVTLPLGMMAAVLVLAGFGASVWVAGACLALWGLASSPGPAVWFTWLSRALPEETEAGGGLIVAVIQLGITAGAVAGGFAFDGLGPLAPTLAGAALLGFAAGAALLAGRALRSGD